MSILFSADLGLVFFVLRICICAVFLHRILGWSAFVGMGVFICLTPIPGFVAKYSMKLQAKKMKKVGSLVPLSLSSGG